MPRSNKFIPAVNVQASVTYTRKLVKIPSEEDIQPSKWKCTVFQITEVRRDVIQRVTTNHRHFVDDKKFTVCPTVVEMQSIHPLHPSHILISLITATEMTERVYRASIDDIRRYARCR